MEWWEEPETMEAELEDAEEVEEDEEGRGMGSERGEGEPSGPLPGAEEDSFEAAEGESFIIAAREVGQDDEAVIGGRARLLLPRCSSSNTTTLL